MSSKVCRCPHPDVAPHASHRQQRQQPTLNKTGGSRGQSRKTEILVKTQAQPTQQTSSPRTGGGVNSSVIYAVGCLYVPGLNASDDAFIRKVWTDDETETLQTDQYADQPLILFPAEKPVDMFDIMLDRRPLVLPVGDIPTQKMQAVRDTMKQPPSAIASDTKSMQLFEALEKQYEDESYNGFVMCLEYYSNRPPARSTTSLSKLLERTDDGVRQQTIRYVLERMRLAPLDSARLSKLLTDSRSFLAGKWLMHVHT